MREVGGRTLLVVGLGGIGTEVARRAHALGMRVIAIRNSRREGPDFVAEVGLPEDLHAFAARADAVVSAVPLTPETTDLFDAAFFAAMKPGGWFINVGRGRSVVTDALVAALDSGRLAGAGLDVTEPEPLPAGHTLWSRPNVIITPHVAASSDVQGERYWVLVAENLRRYAAGEPLLNVVDIERGY
jgi:phosphoglycerate dehydrogenase-like enzyme